MNDRKQVFYVFENDVYCKKVEIKNLSLKNKLIIEKKVGQQKIKLHE